MSKQVRNSILLLLTAFIWGVAFVAQSEGGDAVGPYTFNCIRSIIGGCVLIPVIFIIKKITTRGNENKSINIENKPKENKKILIIGGILCGSALFMGSTLQQLGLYYGTTAGKAGFLTACYILLVPILGLFLKKKCGFNIWIGVFLSLIGLYLLCIDESFSLAFGDILVLCSAMAFSMHILLVDYFSPKVNGVKMSCIQFFTCGLIGVVPTVFVEMGTSTADISSWIAALGTMSAWVPILYAGVLSCGVAYTLQIIGQDGLNPTIASLLMSLESVFAVLAGWILLGQNMSIKEVSGCVLIFAAIILAQLPIDKVMPLKHEK